MRKTIPGGPMWLVLATTVLIGCDAQDERLQQLARDSLNRQAEQNRHMSQQSRQVADATKHLIDAQAQGREELIGIQKQIQAERMDVSKQVANLHQERQQLMKDQQDLVQAQHREPVIANAILSAAMLVAAVLPLIFACYLLKTVHHDPGEDPSIAELMTIMVMASEAPGLRWPVEPGFPRLDERSDNPAGASVCLPAPVDDSARRHAAPARVFVVVEGRHDIEFLKRISRILHEHDAQLPDLERLEQESQIIFVPTGGGDLASWTRRFAGLQMLELHIYDREVPPLTLERQETVAQVNRRVGCKAVLTGKRAIENYLHPKAILAASGIELAFDDESCVAELFAKARLNEAGTDVWSKLPRRGRRRARDQAKRLLNTSAVEKMTPQLLQERDPNGDVIGWLTALAEMLRDSLE